MTLRVKEENETTEGGDTITDDVNGRDDKKNYAERKRVYLKTVSIWGPPSTKAFLKFERTPYSVFENNRVDTKN